MTRTKTLQQMFKRYRRPGDIVFAWLFLIFALFLLWNLFAETTWLAKKSLFAQPRFWPAVGVIGMAIFGVFHLIGSFCSPRIPGRWTEVWLWVRALEYAAWFLAYVLTVPLLGYLPSTVLFAVILALRVGYRGARPLIAAAAASAAIVILFRTLLQVKIPGGAAYDYLPEGLRVFMLTYL